SRSLRPAAPRPFPAACDRALLRWFRASILLDLTSTRRLRGIAGTTWEHGYGEPHERGHLGVPQAIRTGHQERANKLLLFHTVRHSVRDSPTSTDIATV